MDRIFGLIKTRLVDEHHRSKEDLTKFLEKEIEELEEQEKELNADLEHNAKERTRVVQQLERIEKEKKAEEDLGIEEVAIRKHRKPTVVEFPVLVMPFTGDETFIQICHKVNPRICFFG